MRERATNDHTIPKLIEDLGDARMQLAVVVGASERHADVAACSAARIANEPPWLPATLVVQGGQQIPRPVGFVLDPAAAARRECLRRKRAGRSAATQFMSSPCT